MNNTEERSRSLNSSQASDEFVEIADDPADLTGIEEIQCQAVVNPNPSEDPIERISSNQSGSLLTEQDPRHRLYVVALL